ncbi:MAG: hypothetical protein ACREFW_07905 [Rhizomicrobium sp.]
MIPGQEKHSLQYLLASLKGIARALEDFGFREEAGELFRVERELERKVSALHKQ